MERIEKNDIDGDSLKEAYSEDLSQALAELANLINPLTSDYKNKLDIYYLLSLWASLRVYQIEPYIESTDAQDAKVISLENGWKIIDYGYYLATSPGENYHTYCTDKLISTVQEMMHILAGRGVKQVGLLGNSVAMRAAWMEAQNSGIAVSNYYPSAEDYALLDKMRKLRAESKKGLVQSEENKYPT